MGLFSFIGKAIGGIAKTALGIVPGGGLAKTVLGVAGSLLHAKTPMASTPMKINVLGRFNPALLRGKNPNLSVPIRGNTTQGYVPGPQVLQRSPVMPGGVVATARGMMPQSGNPPAAFGSSGGKRRRKRRSTSSRSSSRKRSGRKRSGGRKLKFGSPAWRKKYMRKRR